MNDPRCFATTVPNREPKGWKRPPRVRASRKKPRREGEAAADHGAAEHTGLMGRLVRVYERLLRIALERPLALGLFCVVLVVASFFCYRALGTDLLPLRHAAHGLRTNPS